MGHKRLEIGEKNAAGELVRVFLTVLGLLSKAKWLAKLLERHLIVFPVMLTEAEAIDYPSN